MSTGARCCSADALAGDAGLEHLFDGLLQPVGVGEHDAVELAPLRLADLARLQRLQVQADRRDRRLQLVRDGVDERVVLVVAAQLAHEKHRVDDDAGDDEGEGEDAEARAAGRAAPLTRIQPMLSVTAAATRTTQSVTKTIVAVLRRVTGRL